MTTPWTTHGHVPNRTKSPTYQSWCSMVQRCTNPKRRGYHRYGGRGITVCGRWIKSFENFLEDMGERPTGTSLDRIDNSGNYEPGNCRWATPKQQRSNTRNVYIYELDGVRRTRRGWAAVSGIPYGTLRSRLEAGMSIGQALAMGKCITPRSRTKVPVGELYADGQPDPWSLADEELVTTADLPREAPAYWGRARDEYDPADDKIDIQPFGRTTK